MGLKKGIDISEKKVDGIHKRGGNGINKRRWDVGRSNDSCDSLVLWMWVWVEKEEERRRRRRAAWMVFNRLDLALLGLG